MKIIQFILIIIIYPVCIQAHKNNNSIIESNIKLLKNPIHDTIVFVQDQTEAYYVDEFLKDENLYLFNNTVLAEFHYPDKILSISVNYQLLEEKVVYRRSSEAYSVLVLKDKPSSVVILDKDFKYNKSGALLKKLDHGADKYFIKYKTIYEEEHFTNIEALKNIYQSRRIANLKALDDEIIAHIIVETRPFLCYYIDDKLIKVDRARTLLSKFERSQRRTIRRYIRQNNISFDNTCDIKNILNFMYNKGYL